MIQLQQPPGIAVLLRLRHNGLPGTLRQQLFYLRLHHRFQFRQLDVDGSIAAVHIVPPAARQIAIGLVRHDGQAVAALGALQQAGEPCVLALAAVAHLAVMSQLCLYHQKQRRRHDAHTVQHGCPMVLGLGVLPRIGLPLAHQQHTVYAVKGLRWAGDLHALPQIVEPHLLVRHHIGGVVQQAGQRYVVPCGAFWGGDALGGQLAGQQPQRHALRGVFLKDPLHHRRPVVGDKGRDFPAIPPASPAIVEAVGCRAAGPRAQRRAAVIVVPYALGGGLPLQLGEHHDDVQHSPSHGRLGVEVLIDRHELHMVLLQHLP